jgi:hypothetical protein
MSILSDQTDYKAIQLLTECINKLDQLDKLQITNVDAFDISQAKNLMKTVVESNQTYIEGQGG